MSKRNDYDESAVRVLKGLEPVQLRPGMYTRTDNPNHIIQEVIDNAQDEALAGYASNIIVQLHEDHSVSVEDNGRGIPTGINKDLNLPTMQVVFTQLHAGGKFDKGSAQAYGFTGGLHGVGVSVTNALSTRLEVTVWRDGYQYTMAFENGAVVEQIKKTKLKGEESEKRGTRVQSWPNGTYFESPNLAIAEMERYLRSKAVLMPGVRMEWIRPDKSNKIWDYPEGMSQYLQEEVGQAEWGVPPIVTKLHYPDGTPGFDEGEGFDLAIGWLNDGRAVRESFVNLIPTPAGGRHETGLKAGSLEAIRNMADRLGLVPKGVKIEAEDVMGRVSYLLSVKLMDPQFQNQTKDRMTSEKGHRLVLGLWRDAFELWLNDHLETAKNLIDQIVQDAVHRTRSATKTERRKTTNAMMLPGKLADCDSKNVEDSELYLVEGDSAGGCLSPFEIIDLADGRALNFLELKAEQDQGIQNFCYTIKENGKVGIAPIKNVRLTKHNAELVEVELDNGQKIKCTPCHPFMLRDGSYLRADKMTPGQDLMPLNKKVFEEYVYGIKGYERVFDLILNKWVFTHRLADEYNLENGIYKNIKKTHKHHVDFNKLNNNPTNIVQMSKIEHIKLHQVHADKTLRKPGFEKRMSERMKQPETRAILSKNAIKQWEDPTYKEFMIKAWKDFYNSNAEYRNLNKEQLNKAQQDFWASEENRIAQSERVKKYFEDHPKHRHAHSQASIEQWKDPALLKWRAETTSKQWTDEFRVQRKEKMDKHYFDKSMKAFKDIEFAGEKVCDETLQLWRKAGKITDRYVMKLSKFLDRFFEGNIDAFEEAMQTYNHRVVAVRHLDYREDVYDLEVPGSHNFALGAGVFVHNSAKQGRDNQIQAILPLRGKLLNTWEVDALKLLASETIADIAAAIGVQAHSWDEVDKVDLSRLRYGRICIMADADVDGQHIQVLLLTLFVKHFPALIVNNHVYIAQSPLYRVDAPPKKGKKVDPDDKGRRRFYALDEDELKQIQSELFKEGVNESQITVNRFKGLGEMNPDQLWETTMNPETRRQLLIQIGDAKKAEEAFSKMMGKQHAKDRKEWMEKEGGSVL